MMGTNKQVGNGDRPALLKFIIMRNFPKIGASLASQTQKHTPEIHGALIDDIRSGPSSHDSTINVDVSASPSPSLNIGAPLVVSDDEPAQTLSPSPHSSLVANTSAANKSTARKFKTKDELNWSDRDEMLLNRKLFESKEQHLFGLADTKRTEFPNGFDKGNYFENLPFVIASGFERSKKIVCCGNLYEGKSLPCDQWPLCSKCAYMRGVDAAKMYAGTFNKASFYHVTLGFGGDIPFDITNSTLARGYWATNQNAVSHIFSHALIDGAYLAHELKIRSFLPLRVNPHTHVIVTASKFPDELKQEVEAMIAGAEGINLKPSIEVKFIDNQTYHDKCIRYLTKAMDLQEPYLSAWRQHCSSNRSLAPALNLEMRVFLDAQAAAFGGMDKIVRLGNLMPQRKSFIGVKAADRKKETKKKKRGKVRYGDTRTIINK